MSEQEIKLPPRCRCISKLDIEKEWLVSDDTIHTEFGCYHASVLPMWDRLHTVAEVLRSIGMERLANYLVGSERR